MFSVLKALFIASIAVCIQGNDEMTLDRPGSDEDDSKQFMETLASTGNLQSDYDFGSRQRCTYSFTVNDGMGSMRCGGDSGGRSVRDDDTSARLVRLQERLNNEVIERQKYHERMLIDMSESMGLRRFLNEKKAQIDEIPKLGLHLQRLFLNTSKEINDLREEHALITEELNKRLGTSDSFKANQAWLENNRKSRERYPFDLGNQRVNLELSTHTAGDFQGQSPDSEDFPRADQRRLFHNMSVDVQLHGRRLSFLEQAISNVSSRIDRIVQKDKTEIEGLRTRFIIERSQRMTLSGEVDKIRDKMARLENQEPRAAGPYNCPQLDKSCRDLDYNIKLLNFSHVALKGKVDNALQRHIQGAQLGRSSSFDNELPILKDEVEHLKRDHEIEVNNIWNAIKDEEVERERLRSQLTTAMGVNTRAVSSQKMQQNANKIKGIEQVLQNITQKIETLQASYLDDAHALETRLTRAYNRKQQLMDDLENQMNRLTQTHNQNDVFQVKAEINNLQDKLVRIQEEMADLQQDVYLLKTKHMQQLRHLEGVIGNITKDSNVIKREEAKQTELPSARKLSDIEAQLGEQHEKYLHIQSAMLQLTTLVHDIKKKQSSLLENLEEKFNEVDQENIIEQVSERMIKKKFDDSLEFHLSDQKIRTKHMEESLFNMTEKLKALKADHKNKTQDLMVKLYNEHNMRQVLEDRLSAEEDKNANLSKIVKKQNDMMKQLDQQVVQENTERKRLSKLVIKLEDNVDTIVVKLGEQRARARYLINKVQQTSTLKNNMTNLVKKMKEELNRDMDNRIQSTLSEKSNVQNNMMSMLTTLRDDLAREIEHRRTLESNLRDAISERETLVLQQQDDLQKRETMYKKILEGERQRQHMNRHINTLIMNMNARAERERLEAERRENNPEPSQLENPVATTRIVPTETTTSSSFIEATTMKPRKSTTKRYKKRPKGPQKPTTKQTPAPKKKTTPRRPTRPRTRKPVVKKTTTTTPITTTMEPTKMMTPKRMKTPNEPKTVPIDCSGYNALGFTQNGLYRIKPNSSAEQFHAYCKHDKDGGWTVIQRREDASVNFDKGWVEYRTGFGNPAGEHWLGNEHLHHLTATGNHQLRIDIKLPNNSWVTSTYDGFKVESEIEWYLLRIGNFLGGNAGDGLLESTFSANKDMYFSTKGEDHDDSYWYHCAEDAKSGWWFSDCGVSNLNGPYKLDECKNRECFVWGDLIDYYDDEQMDNYVIETVMRIRRVE